MQRLSATKIKYSRFISVIEDIKSCVYRGISGAIAGFTRYAQSHILVAPKTSANEMAQLRQDYSLSLSPCQNMAK